MTEVPLPPLDLDARYRVQGWGGVAFWLKGYATTTYVPDPTLDCTEDECDHDTVWCWTIPEPEIVEDRSMVVAVMVGDDTEHVVDVDDLTPLDREDYCGECGQIGCTHDGLER